VRGQQPLLFDPVESLLLRQHVSRGPTATPQALAMMIGLVSGLDFNFFLHPLVNLAPLESGYTLFLHDAVANMKPWNATTEETEIKELVRIQNFDFLAVRTDEDLFLIFSWSRSRLKYF
jgi:hypothetical protein